MSTATSTSSDVGLENETAQAQVLWAFINTKKPRFTLAMALDVVRALRLTRAEDTKKLAKRLREFLADRGVAIKHTAALEGATRMQGDRSWHTSENGDEPRLKLFSVGGGGEATFSSWSLLSNELISRCRAWLRQNPSQVLEMQFRPQSVLVGVPQPEKAKDPSKLFFMPVLTVTPVVDDETWLDAAPPAFERVRRAIEEEGLAVMDGLAVLRLCRRTSPPTLMATGALSPGDACNSELVLLREDNELRPGDGYEIARGDELGCWDQLDLAAQAKPGESFVLRNGAWTIGDARYVWMLSTLRPDEYVPGQQLMSLSAEQSQHLFHRYRQAKSIFSGRLRARQMAKQLDFLSGPKETFRVDLHRLLRVLHDAGHTWESYSEMYGEVQEREPMLPLGFVMQLGTRLGLKDVDRLFQKPPRAEMARIDDDSLLRALMPRVDKVRYQLSCPVNDEVRDRVREAIDEFGSQLQFQRLVSAGTVKSEERFPYLVHAHDCEDLRLSLRNDGLVMYAAVLPLLMPTDGVIETAPGMWKYAFGYSLFLDIDRLEEVSQ